MEKQQVTHLCCVPTLYQAILDILQSGEGRELASGYARRRTGNRAACGKKQAKACWVELINEYGPTENSVNTTMFRYGDDPFIPTIGRPISNTSVYIIGAEPHQLQPIGRAGELCIAGEGLARAT